MRRFGFLALLLSALVCGLGCSKETADKAKDAAEATSEAVESAASDAAESVENAAGEMREAIEGDPPAEEPAVE